MNIKIPKISEKLAEEVGWHIGDGSMNYYKIKGKSVGMYQLRGHMVDDVLHYQTRIKPIFEELYGIKINLRKMPSTRVFGFQIRNNSLIKFKEQLGLNLGPKLNISLPSSFLVKSSLQVALIRGIFDTDGCLYLEPKNKKLYPRLEITTISFSLANQIKEILTQLGFRVGNWTSNAKSRIRPDYKIAIRGDKMLHKFMDVIRPANPKHVAKYQIYRKALNNGFVEFNK